MPTPYNRKNKSKGLLTLVVLTLCVPFNFGYAASDGNLGPTSEGSSPIGLEVSRLVKISNLVDIDLGTYGGSGDLRGNHNVCIWTNDPDETYVVTAAGSGVDNAFQVTSDAGTLSYTVYWNDNTGTENNTPLNANQVSSEMENADSSSLTCGGGNNANFEIVITQNELLGSRPGTYTGVVTFVIAPP